MMQKDETAESNSNAPAFYFWTAVVISAVFWSFAPPFFMHNYPLDTMEQEVVSLHFVLATFKHPQLQSWILGLLNTVFCHAEWVPYFAAQTAALSCIITVLLFARKFLSPPQATLAALCLLSYFYFNYDSPVYNNRTFMRLFWLLAIVCFYCAMEQNKKRYWLLTGIMLAAGIYCKFTAGILIIAIIIYLLVDADARKCWKTPGLYIAAAVCFSLVSLLLYSIKSNDMIKYAENSIGTKDTAILPHFLSPLNFLIYQIPIIFLMLIPVIPLIGLRWRVNIEHIRSSQFRFLTAMIGIPLFLQLLAAAYFGGNMRTALGCHLWLLLPLFLLFTLKLPEMTVPLYSRCLKTGLIMVLIFAAVGTAAGLLSPLIKKRDTRIHFPGKELAAAVQDIWQERFQEPLKFVRGDDVAASPVSVYLETHPCVFSPLWATEDEFRQHGGVLLWFISENGKPSRYTFKNNFGNNDFYDMNGKPDKWIQQFPNAEILPPLKLPPKTIISVPPVEIGIAVVPPCRIN